MRSANEYTSEGNFSFHESPVDEFDDEPVTKQIPIETMAKLVFGQEVAVMNEMVSR